MPFCFFFKCVFHFVSFFGLGGLEGDGFFVDVSQAAEAPPEALSGLGFFGRVQLVTRKASRKPKA